MNKIAYISSTRFGDCDIPLLSHLKDKQDITYILKVFNDTKKMTLFNIQQLKGKGGIYHSSKFPELKYLAKDIDLNKTYILNMTGKHDWSFGNLWAMICLVFFLFKNKFKIIHITWPPRYGDFLIYLFWKKLVLTVHDPLPHSSENTFVNKMHRFVCFKLIRHFILLNKSQKELFQKTYHIKREHIYISKLGTYDNLLNVKATKSNISKYILFFGTISSHKGVEYLCQAMEIVCKKFKNAKLVIAGSGKIYFNLEKLNAYKKGNIILANHYLSERELVGYIKSSFLVVCPYIDATQSGVIMSAFAFNKPVIATNVGGLPEMVINKRHGIIVPPKDAKALNKAIEYLLDNASIIDTFSKNIEQDYHIGDRSWEAISLGISNFYNNILS